MVLGGNPVYNAPVELDWAGAQRKAKLVLRMGYSEDETFAVSDWSIPQLHYLESWGDARTSDGSLVPIQPLILPLFEGMTELELLARLGGLEPNSPYDIVRETFRSATHGGDEEWKRFLFNGFQEGSATKPVEVKLDEAAVHGAVQEAKPATPGDKLEVVFHGHYCVGDGRYNNNGWLQELPEPVTQAAWDNLIVLSPATFKKLGLVNKTIGGGTTHASLVKVTLDGREVVGPAWWQPGMADNTVGLALGYGRERSGRVGRGAGYDAYTVAHECRAPYRDGRDGKRNRSRLHPVSTVQHHWSMEGRPAVREANLDEYYEHPDFAQRDEAGAAGGRAAVSRIRSTRRRRRLAPMGDGGGFERVRRLQHVRGGLPEREQHSDRRQGPGAAAAAKCTGCALTAITPPVRPAGQSRRLASAAGALPCTARPRRAKTSARSTPRRTTRRA